MTTVVPDLSRSANPPQRKRSILIVDDHAILRCGWHYLISVEDDLEICGEAGTVGEALEMLRTTKPDIVVTDLLLPDRNGMDLVKELKLNHPEIPVLVVSMFDEKIFCERVLKAGALGYVMKEEATEQLVNAIRRVLSGRRFISQAMAEHYLTDPTGGPVPRLPFDRLTNRELEVFNLIGQGLTQDKIATQLNVRPRTVEAHRTKIIRKLGLSGSRELLSVAVCHYQLGLHSRMADDPAR